jgi:SAM-dependent methyltransferase
VIHGSSPEKYRAWLEHTVDYALQHPIFGESFVAINAWNEWAEAAYLEPDVHYGGAYLNATAKALCGIARGAEAGAVEHSQEPSEPRDFDAPSAASAAIERSLPEGYFTKVRSEVFHMIGEPVGKVLELGCGTGNTIAELKRQGLAEWVGGIELESIAAAQIPEDVDQVWIGNFENMTLDPPPHDIDLILCLDVLEHLVDPWSTIKRLHHFLAPGGAIIASIPNIRNKDILRSLILRGEWKYQDWGILDRTHLRFFTKDSAKELMECSGLSVDRIEPAEPISFKPWQMGALLNRITRGRYGEFQVVQFLIRARHSAAAS